MNYTKLTLSLLLVIVTGTLLKARTAQDLRDLKNRMRQEQNAKSVDRNELLDEYNKEMNLLFDLDSLSIEQKNLVFNMKKACSEPLLALVAKKYYSSQWGAALDMSKVNAECFAGWAESIARATAEEHTRKVFKQTDATIIKNAGDKARKDALERASNKNKGCLRYIVNGTLENNVRNDIDTIAAARDKAAAEKRRSDAVAAQKAAQKKLDAERAKKAKPTDEDVHEVYPQTQESLTQVRLNIERKLQVRDEVICCHCREKFVELGQRVNLPCRHVVCPCCLLKSIYQYNTLKCPTAGCTAQVSKADFPYDYLVKACEKQNVPEEEA